MSEIFKIECPKCGEKFDAGSAFNAHLESTKKNQEEKIKKESEKKFQSQLEAKDKQIEKSKKDAEKKAQLEAEKKYQSKLASKDKEIEKNIKDTEKRVSNKLTIDHQNELQKKEDEIEQMKKAKEITERRLTQKTEEMNRMMKQGSVELQGEIQEERLQDYLRKIFPEDDIEEIGKGVKGGDCIQTINYKNKTNIAKIYFESKDTKVFNEQWASKLLKDMKVKGIANGIIVCSPSCMPADFNKHKSYVERHGNVITIIPMFKPIIHAVVNRIRSILILKAREEKDHEIPEIMKKCWDNLNSPNFTLPIRHMASEIKTMSDQLDKEETSFQLSMSKKRKTITNIKENLTDMVSSFFINVDSNIFPEDILIPQEKVKKLTKSE